MKRFWICLFILLIALLILWAVFRLTAPSKEPMNASQTNPAPEQAESAEPVPQAGMLTPELVRDLVLRPALSYHPGTAGSSLAAANASVAILDFAVNNDLRLVGQDYVNQVVADALALLTEEERGWLAESMPGIIALIDETLEIYPENSGLYDDAGCSDLIKTAVDRPYTSENWSALKTALFSAGIPAESSITS